MATEAFHPTETPSFGQKASVIIHEDQARVARRRGTAGIYPTDRPVIQFGGTLSAIIMANYRDEKVNEDVAVETNSRQQLIFDSEVMAKLFAEVKPGKPAKAEGKGWYHHILEISFEQSQWVREEPVDDIDYHVSVECRFAMRLSRDAKKVVLKLSAKPADSSAATKPIIKRRLVFNAFMLPDFIGMFAQRLSEVPH